MVYFVHHLARSFSETIREKIVEIFWSNYATVAMRLMGLDTIRHLGNPPSRGWFTQEDLLDRQGWMDSGSDDDDHVAGSSFTGDSNVYNFALGAGINR